jgi:ParB-like chromosome segregation protein Spo0J
MEIFDEIIKTSNLKDFPGNPRIMSEHEKEKLKNSIKEFGIVDPLIVDEDNVVIGGNQRLQAIKELQIDSVPIRKITGLSNIKKKVLNLALNKISGHFEEIQLNQLLTEIKLEDELLLSLTGFDEKELELLKKVEFFAREKEFDENIKTDTECPKCGYKW